ncbi:SPOR domain-containing protein [Immundisolibacter sp.]|uniref:SPOR domain-containing protein n=1 Tax=Immundisolibacter sp. TaxID=1934948 RepID=UPI002B0AABB3|nr:SPOR domain-containing protein [Immundisolibacter sp.]MEA3219853.1 Cell division protein DedD [Immundisolibacter sp.]
MDQARLKYRIVGGIVLVALAAILVPVLSDMRQPLPQGPQAIDIPAEPTDGLASRLPVDAPPLDGTVPEPEDIPPPAPPPPLGDDTDVVPPDAGAGLAPPASPGQARPPVPVARPAPASPPRAPAPAVEPAPAPVVASKPPVAKPAPPPAPKPAVVAKPAPASAPAPIPVAKPAAPAPAAPIQAAKSVAPAAVATATAPSVQQAWVVQLGVFGNLKTAIDLREQLRKAGHSAFTEEITTPQGKALRVRVGPELDRAKAQAVRDRLAKETGHDGIVVAYP